MERLTRYLLSPISAKQFAQFADEAGTAGFVERIEPRDLGAALVPKVRIGGDRGVRVEALPQHPPRSTVGHRRTRVPVERDRTFRN